MVLMSVFPYFLSIQHIFYCIIFILFKLFLVLIRFIFFKIFDSNHTNCLYNIKQYLNISKINMLINI